MTLRRDGYWQCGDWRCRGNCREIYARARKWKQFGPEAKSIKEMTSKERDQYLYSIARNWQ